MEINTETITRFEVIEDPGRRRYGKRNCKIQLSIQDNGRTLKVFVKE